MAGLGGQATVLIVDRDLGFLFWLGALFSEIGCNVVPAFDCAQAAAMVNRLKLKIDVALVSSEMPGAAAMKCALSAAGRMLKIVAIRERAEATEAFEADAILTRPSAGQQVSRQEWLERIGELFGGVQDLPSE